MMSKCIWYISKYIAPPYAAKVGARGFFLLAEFARRGHRPTLITSDSNHLADAPDFSGCRLHEKIDGVDVVWLKTRKYSGAKSFRRILSWLDFELQLFKASKIIAPPPDVVIASSLSLLTIINGLRLRRMYGCKLVFEVRDIWPMSLIEAGGMSCFNPFVMFLAWLEKLGYTKADLIVGTMPNLGEHVKDVAGGNRRVVCVPQGVDESLLDAPLPVAAEYLEKYIPKNKFIVCHAGSIGADNALETLMACARSMQDLKDIHFLIVGDGYLKSQFEEQMRGYENITFAPRVEKKAVQSVLEHADVVYFAVHDSPMMRYGQSLNKVIDYMLSGKPIIASYSGFPSMINEAGCGTYVPTEDVGALKAEIQRMAAMSCHDRKRIGLLGREWILENRRYAKLANDYLSYLF
jgi:glycosyltransferase involved in cell wall biosynthesis